MNLVKCPRGHFYDQSKNSECPVCSKAGTDFPTDRAGLGDEKTVAKFVHSDMEFGNQLTERYLESVRDDEKTISLSFSQTGCRPVAGWLVCISGSQLGRSMIVFSGRNFAGRSKSMDIRLTDDEMISRENHFSIVFDPKGIKFAVVSGIGETVLNGTTISGAKPLKENDVIEVGNTKYLFVPYCNEERNWNEKN